MIQSGEIIRFFRKEKNIKMKELCMGVCTTAFMSQIENCQKIPNAILFEFLMQRMGVSSDEYAIMSNEDEYVYFMWREKVYNAIENKEWNNLKELLQDMETLDVVELVGYASYGVNTLFLTPSISVGAEEVGVGIGFSSGVEVAGSARFYN